MISTPKRMATPRSAQRSAASRTTRSRWAYVVNVVAGARNVSTVPTQALTLLNNPFVLAQAARLAERVAAQAREPESQVDLAYRIAVGRAPTGPEMAIALELIARQSLASFAHVLLNLDEFVYMR